MKKILLTLIFALIMLGGISCVCAASDIQNTTSLDEVDQPVSLDNQTVSNESAAVENTTDNNTSLSSPGEEKLKPIRHIEIPDIEVKARTINADDSISAAVHFYGYYYNAYDQYFYGDTSKIVPAVIAIVYEKYSEADTVEIVAKILLNNIRFSNPKNAKISVQNTFNSYYSIDEIEKYNHKPVNPNSDDGRQPVG